MKEKKVRKYKYPKIPAIKVGTGEYRFKESELDGALGICKTTEHEIVLTPNLNKNKFREVLTHEIIHAIMVEYGATSGLNHIDYYDEEGIVDRMTLGLIDTLSKNKKLFRELFGL